MFPTRKVLALLIYLTVSGGLHSREHLTALLWPQSDERRARVSFRRALALLRQILSETAGMPHLIVEGDVLGCDLTSDWTCDLHELQAAVQAMNGRTVLSSRLFLDQLESAAALYRGEFLGTFSLPDAPGFDDWCVGSAPSGNAAWMDSSTPSLRCKRKQESSLTLLKPLVAGACIRLSMSRPIPG